MVFSDEDDEDMTEQKSISDEILRKKKPVVPEWATTPFLRKTLENQLDVNPEAIFGNHMKTVNLNGKRKDNVDVCFLI